MSMPQASNRITPVTSNKFGHINIKFHTKTIQLLQNSKVRDSMRTLALLALVIRIKMTERENPKMEKQQLLPPVHALSIAWLWEKILYLQMQ